MAAPKHKVEMWAVDKLRPNPENPRTHTEAQIAQIAASITEWGWTNPILVDEDGVILAGHGRLAAATVLGLKLVPVITAAGWSADQKRAYVIADNKLALNASWDVSRLASGIDDLTVAEFDVSLLGFSEDDLARMQTDLDQLALADLAGDAPGKGGTPKEDNPLPNGSVAFSLVMATDARKVVQEAITVMKGKRGCETSAEALVAICREWMEKE